VSRRSDRGPDFPGQDELAKISTERDAGEMAKKTQEFYANRFESIGRGAPPYGHDKGGPEKPAQDYRHYRLPEPDERKPAQSDNAGERDRLPPAQNNDDPNSGSKIMERGISLPDNSHKTEPPG